MQREPNYAVFLKAYAWDAFVQRQAKRCQNVISRGDFFLSLDETNGPIAAHPVARTIRTSNGALLAMGYADRSERGALLWWNADYPHYQALDLFPDYDYYVFQEYDVTWKGSFDELVERIAEAGADFVALPIREEKQDWCWTHPHQLTYTFEQIEGCLMSLSIFSKRALSMLARRRLIMSEQTDIPFWPSAEVFLPTEIKAAGYSYASLARFVNVTRYDWRPPSLEEEVDRAPQGALFHPVYDRRRFLNWAIGQSQGISDFFDRHSSVMQALGRVPFRYRLLPYLSGLIQGSALFLKNRLPAPSQPKS